MLDDPQVRALSDRAEILDLVSYCLFSVDSKDWDATASCFTDDAEIDFGGRVGPVRGAAEVADVLRRNLQSLDGSQHIVTNSLVRLDGDEATHIAYVNGFKWRGDRVYSVGCRYDDRLRRTPDGWRLCSRVVSRLWKVGDPDAIRPETVDERSSAR